MKKWLCAIEVNNIQISLFLDKQEIKALEFVLDKNIKNSSFVYSGEIIAKIPFLSLSESNQNAIFQCSLYSEDISTLNVFYIEEEPISREEYDRIVRTAIIQSNIKIDNKA
jgi:hypothetical protein